VGAPCLTWAYIRAMLVRMSVNTNNAKHPTRLLVAQNIRSECRKRFIRTHAFLVDVLNVHPSTVSRKLKGTVPFSTDEVALIAERLDISPADLFAEAEQQEAA